MMQKFTIPGRLPSINEYSYAERSHWSRAAALKKQHEEYIQWIIKKANVVPFLRAVNVSIVWFEKTNRRDFDNVTFGVKVILDAMVKIGIIPDDGNKWIKSIKHEKQVDKINPRIEVILEEINDTD